MNLPTGAVTFHFADRATGANVPLQSVNSPILRAKQPGNRGKSPLANACRASHPVQSVYHADAALGAVGYWRINREIRISPADTL